MDATIGTVLLSTGDKPRALFQLAIYNGTNSASADIAWVVVPASAGNGIVTGQMAIAGNIGFNLGTVDANLGAATEVAPLVAGPFATKGAGVGSPIAIIPPNCYLFATAIGATNGTAIANCISAELD